MIDLFRTLELIVLHPMEQQQSTCGLLYLPKPIKQLALSTTTQDCQQHLLCNLGWGVCGIMRVVRLAQFEF